MSEDFEIFNLYDDTQGIARELSPGLLARIFVGDQAMISVITAEPNTVGKLHSHPQEQWGILLEGDGVRIQDGVEYPIKAGDFWRTPGNVEHAIRAGADGMKSIDVFAPPRDEYKKPGSGFGDE